MTDTEIKSLREWLTSWGDGKHWADDSGRTVPIAKTSLIELLDDAERLRAGMKELMTNILDDRQLTPLTKASYGHQIERLLDKDAP